MKTILIYLSILIGLHVVAKPIREMQKEKLELSEQGHFTNPFRRYTQEELALAYKIQEEIELKNVLDNAEEALV